MSRDGAMEHGEAIGEEAHAGQREQDFSLRTPPPQQQDILGRRAENTPSKNTKRRKMAREGVQGTPVQPVEAGQSVEAAGSPAPPKRPTEQAGTRPRQRGTKYQQKFAQDAAKPEKGEAEAPESGRLLFNAEEKPSEPVDRKLTQASRRAGKLGGKLEKAQKKLPTRRKARLHKEFDDSRGKVVRKLRLEKQVKSRRAHLKGPVPLRPVKGAANMGIGYAHKKLYEVQHENVGTEAGHKAEIAAEGLARSAYRFKKTAPYRTVARLEKKTAKANINLSYRKALHDNPKLKSNPIARMWQKRKIRRQYAKAARKAKKAAGAAKSVAVRIIGAIARHPAVGAVLGILLLLFFFASSAFSSCMGMGMGGQGIIMASSYLAKDKDIDDAELYYTEWETDLQLNAFAAETSHPGFDEYKYNISDIGHNPYQLMAYLTAVYEDFDYSAVQSDLRRIFDEQYSLTFTPEVETRYRDVPVYDKITGLPTGETEQEAYEWHILNVKLTSRPLAGMLAARMDAGQQTAYDILLETKGNRQYTYSPFDFGWSQFVTSYYGYRVHPITGEKDYHKAVDIAVPMGTAILATHDGTVKTAARDGSYGNYIVLEGEAGLTTKYAHCQALLVGAGQNVKRGDVIAKVGSTGDSTGPHLHFEVIKDGQYLNPLYFAICPDDGSTLAPGSPAGPEYGNPGTPMGDGSYAALLAEAQKHLGRPYVFGASGPNYFDCSGFVCWCLNQSGAASVGRTTAQGLYNMSTPVSRADARPGDLVFFHSTWSSPNVVSHVGIYLGNGQMIHCGDPISYASIDTSYWQSHLYAFGRI